ncbi:MAG: transglutaminase domain-containing protein [Planctomycetaceae bacterium]
MTNAATVQLEQTFRLSLYGLAMFSGLILGLAEGGWLPYGTLLMAVVGYRLTESAQQSYLGQGLSNLAGLIAVCCAAWEFFGDNPEGRLLAGTHLVVYATWIVFLQKVSPRKYWSICALSVLQVAVAAVLTNDRWYGGALIVFSIFSMWTLAVFSLYQAVEQVHRLQPASQPVAVPGSGARRFTQAVSEVGHAIQFDGIGRWITFRFASGVILLSVAALLMSAVFYVLTPRVWIGRRVALSEASEEPELRRRMLTGFTPQVKLGEMGQILESTAPVMTIHAYDLTRNDDRRLSSEELAASQGFEEPLFRGSALTKYQRGSWENESSTFGIDATPLPGNPIRADLRQEIDLEPIAEDVVFSFGTPIAGEIGSDRGSLRRNWLTGLLTSSRRSARQSKTISYRLFMENPARSEDGMSRLPAWSPSGAHSSLNRYLSVCRSLPKSGLERMQELAESLADEEARKLGRAPTAVELARRLESHLRDSGTYAYSVNLSIQDSRIDPTEDFLFNRKTGHCEYFATALALMLRAVDVPTRLVNGFKGGETSYRGQIQVQQRHAHAWVEAYDEPSESWLVLDPTPAAARAESVAHVAGSRNWLEQFLVSSASMWNDWVMNFTPERQHDELYAPLRELGQRLWAQGEELTSNGPAALTFLWHFFENPRELFTFQGALVISTLSAFVIGAVALIQGLIRWWRAVALRGTDGTLSGRLPVPFYERFVELMSARGFHRNSSQTPAEFAAEISHSLQGNPHDSLAGNLPQALTEFFYQVRYGETRLSPVQQGRVEQALEQLERLFQDSRSST